MAGDKSFRKNIVKTLLQAAFLLLMGALIGVGFNALHPGKLPWTRVSTEVDASIPTVNMTQAWMEYQKGHVQFVDARSPSEYAAGHLPGALSIPEEGAEAQVGKLSIPAGKEIVIYCSDPTCPKSSRLASLLQKHGVKGIRVMPEGWAGWSGAGLPSKGNGGG
jgi:rhodanese-related sulfurtransferase